ncbi:MAG: hypothetical protein HC927_00715 [Deltaproteobacteria bacterium]|nr:hypothetical protein [Deltaproteobacteria bacterium]
MNREVTFADITRAVDDHDPQLADLVVRYLELPDPPEDRPEDGEDSEAKPLGQDAWTMQRFRGALQPYALWGKSAEEVKALREAWERAHPGESLDERIMSELSGRDAEDFRYLLQGELSAEDYAGRLQRQIARVKWELDNYSAPWASAERKALEFELERLRRAQWHLETQQELPEDQRDPRVSQFYEAVFSSADRGVDSQIDAYRRGVDSGLDTITTVMAITAALVVGLATGGAGAAAIIPALVASLAGTAGTMATKAIVLGGAYGWEDIGTDIAMGAVDAVVSVATAGIADDLLKAGRVALMAERGGLSRIAARIIAHGAEALASAAPTALVSTATSEAVLESRDSFGEFLAGFGTQVGMGVALDLGIQAGLASGGAARRVLRGSAPPDLPPPDVQAQAEARAPAIQRRGADVAAESPSGPPTPPERPPVRELSEADVPVKPKAEKPAVPPLETPDTRRLAPSDDTGLPGTPEQRAALWSRFRAENPEASYAGFLDELQTGRAVRDVDEAVARHRRELTEQLLSGVAPGRRGEFADIEIRVLSDAEFNARTRSDAGQAVVEIVDGQPRILVREGAPPNILREEGVHLAQLVDPLTRPKVLALDERVLRDWDNLALDHQLELYRTKLELEIDAQHRLLSQIDDDLTEAVDDTAIRSLREQSDRARINLDNLGRRLDEVEAIGPRQRAEILGRVRERPQWLEQPARLFAKSDIVESLPIDLVDEVLAVRTGKGELGKRRRRILAAVESLLARGDEALRKEMDAALRSLRSLAEDPEIRSRVLLQVLEAAENMPDAQSLAFMRDFTHVPRSIIARAALDDSTLKELVRSATELTNAASTLRSIEPEEARSLVRTILAASEGHKHNEVYVGAARLMRAAEHEGLGRSLLDYRGHLVGEQAGDHIRTLSREGNDLDPNEPRLTDSLRDSLDETGHFGTLERADWPTRRSAWTDEFRHPDLSDATPDVRNFHRLLQTLMHVGNDPIGEVEVALLWRWRNLLLELTEGLGDRVDTINEILRGVDVSSESKSNELIRKRLREIALDHLRPLSGREQVARLRAIMALHPDSTHGHFFMAYRRMRLGYQSSGQSLDIAPPANPKAASTLEGVVAVEAKTGVGGGRSADGVVDVDPAVFKPHGPPGEPPRRMLLEEKSGSGAFKDEQARNYIEIMRSSGGMIGEANASGLIYLADSFKNAETAVQRLRVLIEANTEIDSLIKQARALDPTTSLGQEVRAKLAAEIRKINVFVARYGHDGQLKFMPLPWQEPNYLARLIGP